VGLSERSMRRHLSAAGNSYSVILNTCREDMARNLLSVGTLTIEEIATRLDYSDRSAFERSFRRTAGTTPALFRQLICDMPVPAAAAPL
ncbi:MAG: helix-turn-helix domain-containing protein, partial [Rhodobacteraceae bacterium]|nr:helix-turn-helix domain-containing protein [Paracoccaceae bacterium]